MNETLETCRRLYNTELLERMKNGTGFYEQKKKLVSLKANNKYLQAVHAQVLQDVCLRLDKAFQRFLVGLSRYPRFKRKGRYNSFTYPQPNVKALSASLSENFHFKFPRIGKVKIKIHRIIIGTIKQATIIRDIDQWYVALAVQQSERRFEQHGQNERSDVGVDSGTTDIISLSNGQKISNPKFLKQAEDNIKHLQRELSRKRRLSNNGEKARKALAKAWRKVRRQRDDFAHQLSHTLAEEYHRIVFEDLLINNMVKNHRLASAILDSAWGRLRQLTVYKAERRGGQVILVNPSGTSQKCSRCGWISHVKLTLGDRVFHCLDCGLVIDRDINSAKNILKMGLEQAAHAETKPLLVKRTSKFRSRKQEA
jgi:putative transposase